MEDDDEDTINGRSSIFDVEDTEVTDGRQLWSSQPSVRDSGILLTISSKERKRQEAMYELYTSEQSYLRSLNILVDVFVKSEDLKKAASTTDHHHLFSNLLEIKACSKAFLEDLEKRFRSSPDTVDDVCDIVHLHVDDGSFSPYVTYCSNEVYQQRAFQRLTKENAEFLAALKSVERNPSIMGLPLHSFLLLPMQRVTRLPLLIDMICQRCEPNTPQCASAAKALSDTKKLVKDCNDRAKGLQRMEDMIALQRQLEFKTRSFALVSQSRYLLKRGPLVKLTDDTVLGFKKLTKQEYHAFLFNDVIIMAKKKSDDKYTVVDFCYRHRLKVHGPDDENSFQLIMERNQDGNRVALRLQAESPSSCARWVSSLKTATKKEMPVCQDCVQVIVVRPFRTEEPDLISLQPADILFVIQATSDGWYYGERLVDGRRGWFPSSHAKEVLNEKTRESNYKKGTRMFVTETDI